MMYFEKSLEDGFAKKVEIDRIRAKSLMKSADDALLAAKELQLKEHNLKSILRELYEALRQYCEAVGYLQGYKFQSHEAITYFLSEVLEETELSSKFDRYRKIRNGINYYGREISTETVEKALKEIPEMVKKLKYRLD